MDFFERKIRYFDYLEHGNKIKNGGFMKTEVRGGTCRVLISVRGLYSTDTLQGELFLCGRGEEHKIDTIVLHYGTGTYMEKWNADNLADSGISYADWDGVVIRLSGHRMLQNIWRAREREAPAREPAPESEPVPEQEVVEPEIAPEPEAEPEREVAEPEIAPEREDAEPEIAPEREAEPEREVVSEPGAVESEIAPEPEPETEPEPEVRKQEAEPEILQEPAEAAAEAEEEKRFQTLYEDKWTQLGHYYKKVHPFGDGREYLSVAPRDFIVLPERYQGLVGNSFLLHGYYNYGHVLLGRQQGAGGFVYYLGVPGIYHEREKQVARMFGFEGFEGAADPAEEGSFGYYMLRVDI